MSRTALLLAEIRRTGSTRATIAAVYSRDAFVAANRVEWERVNAALRRRYQPSGIDYIKRMGWALHDAARTA